MKSLVTAVMAATLMTVAASADERYVMVTHTQGTDPFWPVARERRTRCGRRCRRRVRNTTLRLPRDMADMARLIEAAVATQPDGLVVSLPDADALGGAIRAAVEAGIPVITMNSGLESSASLGALMHVGQPERDAGYAAGQRAMAEGVTKGICLNQEAFNTALVDRCTGYFDAMGTDLNQIDVSNDVAQIETRTAAALTADPSIDGVLCSGTACLCRAGDRDR